MHSKSNNFKFTSYNDVNEIADELFDSLRSRYQDNLEKSMGESEFIFDSVQLMHYKCIQQNNPTIALNILYIKEKETRPAYISKINSNCEKQIIINEEK